MTKRHILGSHQVDFRYYSIIVGMLHHIHGTLKAYLSFLGRFVPTLFCA